MATEAGGPVTHRIGYLKQGNKPAARSLWAGFRKL
jgi:hypothetical protein